ncbi:MAG: hypothetical protein DIU64_003090 [Caldicoprobacter oshimai]
MIQKAKVSSIAPEGVRVLLPERGNAVSAPLRIASHVGPLQVGDNVVVVFFSGLEDGLIIAKF